MKRSINGNLYDMLYDPVRSDVDSTENDQEPSKLIPSNNNGFSHHELAISSARTSSTQSKCRDVSFAMPRNIKIYDLRLVAKKGPQV